MKTPVSSGLTVCMGKDEVWIRVCGRANFSCSHDLKKLVHELQERGYHSFVLDLSECLLMDSTFLGVLAGLGLKLSANGNGKPPRSIQLLNPSTRIAELLENLGVTQLFQVRHGQPLTGNGDACTQAPSAPTDKVELTRTCLEAHETLMRVNPENVDRFKDVTRFLAEDLRRLEQKKHDNGQEGSPDQGQVS